MCNEDIESIKRDAELFRALKMMWNRQQSIYDEDGLDILFPGADYIYFTGYYGNESCGYGNGIPVEKLDDAIELALTSKQKHDEFVREYLNKHPEKRHEWPFIYNDQARRSD